MAIRVREPDIAAFSGRLRSMAAAVDPSLQVRNLTTMRSALTREQRLMRLTGITIAVAMLSVLMLSAAGIYSLTSVTVARRRREIGIRAALGGDPTRVLLGIFSRVFGQLALGAAIGVIAALGFDLLAGGGMLRSSGAAILPLVAGVMILVGAAATIGPARRALRIEPTEALRAE
jgi:ABC-type antimicrobial peptide transport system permease subunit